MHLKKIIEKDNKFFIEHFEIVDAIDGSNTRYEELHVGNYMKYFPQIIHYLLECSKEKE